MRLGSPTPLFLFTGSVFLSAVFLALATYQSLYPVTLFAPGLLYLLQVSTCWCRGPVILSTRPGPFCRAWGRGRGPWQEGHRPLTASGARDVLQWLDACISHMWLCFNP